MRATRAEVARLAGVSPAVVSYVLNGGPRNVAPETRRRVEEAISSLEYRPNAIAQALRGGRSGAVGVVVGPGGEDSFSALTPALQRAAIKFGYAMYVSFATDEARERQDARSLVDRQVDALIAVKPSELITFAGLQADGTPVAVIGDRPHQDVSVSLVIDPVVAHRELAERVGLMEVDTVIGSSRLPRPAGRTSDPSCRSLELDTANGGAELLRMVAGGTGVAVMCATDAELGRVLWLIESSGIDRAGYTFTSSRSDLREQDGVEADLSIAWDLQDRVGAMLGDLIKQSDDPDARFPPEHVGWTVQQREQDAASALASWGVGDL